MASDGQHRGLRGQLMKKKRRPGLGTGTAERAAKAAESTVKKRRKKADSIMNQIRSGR